MLRIALVALVMVALAVGAQAAAECPEGNTPYMGGDSDGSLLLCSAPGQPIRVHGELVGPDITATDEAISRLEQRVSDLQAANQALVLEIETLEDS